VLSSSVSGSEDGHGLNCDGCDAAWQVLEITAAGYRTILGELDADLIASGPESAWGAGYGSQAVPDH